MKVVIESAMIPQLRRVLKRLHYPLEVMLVCARWYANYPLSLRHLGEMMQERGVFVDHSTVHRWCSENSASHGAYLSSPKAPSRYQWENG
jgi:putative transposase